MAHFHHQGDRAVVSFSGELTVDAAVDLVETIDMLASAVPKMRVNGRGEDVIFFDGVFFEPSLKSIFFVS